MKKLQQQTLFRYLFRELLLYFVVCFIFFFLVFFVNQILLTIEELLKKHIPVAGIAKLILYSLPAIIAQSAPFATLVGFLMCLGRFMSDNEILVFRATGRSFGFILLPVLILGTVISCFSFYVNDYLLPLGNSQYNKLYQEILLSNPAVEIESNSIKRTENSTLVIGTVEGTSVSDLILFDRDKNGNSRVIISGQTDIVAPDDPSVLMQLDMQNPVAVFFNKDTYTDFDYLVSRKALMNIFTSSFFVDSDYLSPREQTAGALKNKIRELRADENTDRYTLNMYILEYYKKFSMPFGSLFFAMLAMPLAIIFGKQNGQTIGLIVGVFISVLYWAMMIMGQTLGIRNGLNGFWTMWLPDFLIGGIGIILYLRLRVK